MKQTIFTVLKAIGAYTMGISLVCLALAIPAFALVTLFNFLPLAIAFRILLGIVVFNICVFFYNKWIAELQISFHMDEDEYKLYKEEQKLQK